MIVIALALATSATSQPISKCDLVKDALAWGDAHVYLKRYPGPPPAKALFVAMSVSRSKAVKALTFGQTLHYFDNHRRHAVVDLVVDRIGPATWPPDVEDFVMIAYDLRRTPSSVTIRCGKDVLSRTAKLEYGD